MHYTIIGQPLTGSEKTFVSFLSRGRSDKEIAQAWGISLRSAQVMRCKIIKKLGVKNGTEAVAKCLREKIIP